MLATCAAHTQAMMPGVLSLILFQALKRRPCERQDRARPDSLVFEFRLALVDERGRAILLVLGGEQRMKCAPLEQDALAERALVGAVDRFLRRHHHRQREFADLAGG